MTVYQIDAELERFQAFAKAAGPGLAVERLCDFGILVRPAQEELQPEPLPSPLPLLLGKPIALTIMGITHGNEYGGLAVINELLAHLSAGTVKLQVPVAFLLGNPWAARENKRFLDRDLNRSFGRKTGDAREERRARELGAVLKDTAYIVDIHQTSRACDRPFFIFPYNRPSYQFARAVGHHAVVTHWGKPFSTEGMCSDEYVISCGGVGISLELGQNGFDPYQIAVGIEAGLWALRTVTGELTGTQGGGGGGAALARGRAAAPQLYTWADIMPWPERGFVELDEGWYNFKEVRLGERLGTLDGRPLVARADGKLLFPKYLTREQQEALTSRPTELCRIMKPVAEADLPGHP